MQKNIFRILISLLVLALSLPSYAQIFGGNKQTHTATYYNYKTECLEDKLDGSFVFRAWGKGSTKKEAIDQAKRNVLNDVLFKGIDKGKCRIRPLIIELNAEEKYRSYIYNFFNDDEYKYFIHLEKSPKFRKKTPQQKVYGIKIKVQVEALRQKLREDNIINY